MRYHTLNGTVIIYSEALKTASVFNHEDYDYLYEKRRKYRPNAIQLAEDYPGAKSYLKEKLEEEKDWLKSLTNPQNIYDIKEQIRQGNYAYGREQEINEIRIAHLKNQIAQARQRIKGLENILYFMKNKKALANDFQTKIALAKAVPVTSLIKFNNMGFAICPFHNERLPSLKYYAANNTWFCFGCQSGGDSIDFIMKLKNLKFIDAVNFLNNG